MSQYCENCPDPMACAVSGCTGPLVCEACNDPIATPEKGEPNLCRLCREDDAYVTKADLARGRAGLAALRASIPDEGSDEPDVDVEIAAGAFDNAIVTRPGENLIERVEEERQADLERFDNDTKGRG